MPPAGAYGLVATPGAQPRQRADAALIGLRSDRKKNGVGRYRRCLEIPMLLGSWCVQSTRQARWFCRTLAGPRSASGDAVAVGQCVFRPAAAEQFVVAGGQQTVWFLAAIAREKSEVVDGKKLTAQWMCPSNSSRQSKGSPCFPVAEYTVGLLITTLLPTRFSRGPIVVLPAVSQLSSAGWWQLGSFPTASAPTVARFLLLMKRWVPIPGRGRQMLP